MITTVKDLVDLVLLFPPDAKVRFLGETHPVEILSIYSDGCSFHKDGKPYNTEGSKFVYIDLGIPKRKARPRKKAASKRQAPAKKED